MIKDYDPCYQAREDMIKDYYYSPKCGNIKGITYRSLQCILIWIVDFVYPIGMEQSNCLIK